MSVIDRIIAEYQDSPRIVAVLRQKRWLLLSEPEDVRQCVELAKLLHATERNQARELAYQLAELASQPHAGQTLRKRPSKRKQQPRRYVSNGRPHSRPPKGHPHYGGHLWTPEQALSAGRRAICRRWHGGDGLNCQKCEQARARKESRNGK